MRIEKILSKGLAKIPKMIFRPLLERKIKEAGVEMPDNAIDALANHILAGENKPFIWDDPKSEDAAHRDLKLTITDADISEIESAIAKVMESIPELTTKIAKDTGDRIFKRIRDQWPPQDAFRQFEVDSFRENMEARWGVGLSYLRMLLECCRELGAETNKRHNKSKSRRHRFRRWVLVRLHARACQITDEIICLMENGFANGAMARWRTLHEISVVSMLIRDGDEDLAERYIVHNEIEVKRHADEFDATQAVLGYDKISDRQRQHIDAEYAAAIERYGGSFATPYGWAAKYLSLKKPTFKDLQLKSNSSSKNTYYKMASLDVHATARGLFFSLNVISENLLLSGRSNAGLMEPGISAAGSLLIVMHALSGNTTNLDRLVEIHSLLRIREAIETALSRADRKLRKDERGRAKKASRKSVQGD